ncbi:iron (metal) dependent repressor, DtxR family [Psychrobacillus sp. OK028]|uniref:transcriptional regulator MntR n=1 Tax=Psychrobacillus sp. OK028 TaxID=1884359 RepID=UPI00088F9E8B|nr:transcriptional regulator MntR [Psychrobacillus sp. OK028]SDM90181.1 iron (metal) dependent repressor, DtxR family [Psychrobacillus sp. OK028]
MPTPSMEDYLEEIYLLNESKGYARVSDIAEAMSVNPSSVTKMVRRLDKEGYLVYEKYKPLILTTKGSNMGKRLVDLHELLESFLRIIGVNEENIYKDVEGIEHHMSMSSIIKIENLVQYFKEDSARLEKLNEIRKKSDFPQ